MAAAPTDEFELQHIQHLNRDVPPTPGLGRGTNGAQPVAASTNVYEDGESFRMHLGPTLAVPSTPKPGVPVGGAQQVPGDPQPGLQPQRILSKLLLNPMYQPNQPQGASHVITFGGDGPEVKKLQGARGVAVSPDNKIWVVDETKGNLQVYSMGGVRLCQFPPEALGYPSKTPDDVSIGRDGHPWVLMNGLPSSLDSVVQISTDGHITTSFDLPDNVPRAMLRGMALDSRNNHIYVTWASGFTGGVQAFNSDGKLLWGVGPQERLVRPMYAAVDKQGDIFVSDSRSDFIYRYDETGQFVLKFGGPGLSGGQLNRPKGVCVDRSGRIMVVDSANRRVVMYTGRGSYVSHIALSTIYARGVAVGTGGQLVVTNNTAVIVFPHY
uniref:SMP-30/Gluconolactonase/LRE-like region domain-containing protein n=1 Tax=Branchiostoma floridae TaxID=7739 RepID=C3XSJ0_BRAFL|eukprot:XP_002612902.1 hypothetical protein BRAFLDRAFT_94214 [Branchiostoma floridae]